MADSMEGARSVLEGMKKQRDELDAAIAVMEKWIASQGGLVPAATASNGQVGTDEFFRLSTTEAIKKLLKILGKPARSTQSIIDGLKRGGSNTASYTNVYTSLGRLQKKKEVVKVGDNWGLEEWYPPAPARLKGLGSLAEQPTENEPTQEAADSEKEEVLADIEQTEPVDKGKLTRRDTIAEFLRSHGPSTRQEIIAGTDVPSGSFSFCMKDEARFVRGEDGKWRNVE